MSNTVLANPTVNYQGYFPTASGVAAPVAPQAPVMGRDVAALSLNTGGPLVQTGAAGMFGLAARVVPAGTEAAVGAARAILKQPAYGKVAEPLFRLTWDVLKHSVELVLNVVTFQWGKAIDALKNLVTKPFINTGGIARKLATPFTATADVAGKTKLGFGSAVGAGFSTGLAALKSSFIWAIPAAAINTFIDYKYRDQTDKKRLGTNFAADVIGYTATGMAGAAVGAMIGSMTLPIVGTLVGAGVGILLGLAHDKVTKPLISDALHDAI